MMIEIIKILLYALIGYFFATMIHECGHVLMGVMNGWKLFLMVVGPLKLYRVNLNGEIKFGFEKNLLLWGGCGGTAPPVIDERIDKVFAKILIAGPLASLIMGLISLICFFASGFELLLMIGMIALGEGIACILPMNIKTGILYNDGTRFKRICGGGKEAEEEKAIICMALSEISEDPDTKQKREDHLIETLLKSEDTSYRYYGFYYAYQKAKEIGDTKVMESMRKGADAIRNTVSKFVIDSCVMD